MKHNHTYSIAVFALTLALAGAAMLAPGTVYADSGGGTGILTASGDGLAGIRGTGEVTISGNGVLFIRDLAGDATIQVNGNGKRTELPSGWIRYAGFQGQATVSGSKISVALSGYDINLQASGTGSYVLRGNGSYTIEKDGVVIVTGAWTESAEVMQLP